MPKKLHVKKIQHFIPQGFLRKFTIEGEKSHIWQYDKINCQVSKRPVSIRKICNRNYYYYQRDQAGNINHTSVEDAFSEIEHIGIGIIQSLKLEKNKSKIQINEKEFGELSFFLALLLTRGPGFRDGINAFHAKIVQNLQSELYQSGKLPEPPKILKSLIEQKGINEVVKIKIFPEVSLQPMVKMAENISLSMLNKVWTFYIPGNDKNFIVSDNPVSFVAAPGYPTEYVGPAHPHSELTIPLRKDLCVIIRPSFGLAKSTIQEYQFKCFIADEMQAFAINKRTTRAALQYVYSSQNNSELLELVKSLHGTAQKITIDNIKDDSFSIIENPFVESKS